jgi:hypothetical protein
MSPQPRFTVDCKIVGHASPRWRDAPSESQRVGRNDVLSLKRADAVEKAFETALTKELAGFSLKFLHDVSYADDSQPDRTAVIGTEGRGQRDSLLLAGGNRANDDAKYRRTDLTVRIARATQDAVPTKVRRRWGHTTKTKNWYVNVGAGASGGEGVTVTVARIKLRNMWNQEAEGSITTGGGGFGSPINVVVHSWSDEASFVTDRDVGFDDFHGCHVRYTSLGVTVILGRSWSYLTFWGLGSGAASIPVGGWNAGFDVGATLNDGVLKLDRVPLDYQVDYYNTTEWNSIRSDWVTQHTFATYFADGEWALSYRTVNEISQFAADVARDIRTK